MLVYLNSEAGKPTQFYSLSLHRMREGSERNPQFFELAPRDSLLNWIDNFLSRPTTIRDRTLGSWENVIRAVPHIDPDVRPRVHLRAFHATRPGPQVQQPQRHDDFDDYEFWRDDYLFPRSPDAKLKAL